MISRRATHLIAIGVAVVGSSLLETSAAFAEPYTAVRTGLKCSQCHVNRTGGGKRTEFGLIYAQTQLFMHRVKLRGESSFFDGKLSNAISIGGSLRAGYAKSFAIEGQGGERLEGSDNFVLSQATVYLQADLIPDVLSFYVDQIVAPDSRNRELFGLFEGLPLNSYVKVGRMLLPFGFRLLDDEAFIRNRTGYTYERHAVGAEVGLEPGSLSLIANLTDDQLSFRGSTVHRKFRVGASYGRNRAEGGDSVWGVFVGFNFGRFTLLGEGNFISAGEVDRFAALAEMDFLVRRGLNLKLTYEFFDRNRDVSNDRDAQDRITIGLEPFVTQFVQVRVFYQINRFIPQNLTENQNRLTVQFHTFF